MDDSLELINAPESLYARRFIEDDTKGRESCKVYIINLKNFEHATE
jgi:hypothetical protein